MLLIYKIFLSQGYMIQAGSHFLKSNEKGTPFFQYAASIISVLMMSSICFVFEQYIGYRVVALLMLVVIYLLAIFFSIVPVMIAAILSAAIWDFFFIPPIYTFYIRNTEDQLMFMMFFIIASVNAVLTIKIRKAEKISRDREEKENSIRLYNTLLNSLSHELRTPIATIIAVTDTLKDNYDKLSLQNRVELLNEMEKASLRLNRQVENLLNMSRLESGFLQLKKDWCDLNDLVFNIIEKVAVDNHSQLIVFDADESLPLFKIDSGLIEQIIYNILHNSLQYTADDSTIKISATCESDNCIITISDNGKGVPTDKIEHIFEKFYRLPNSKTGGTGLGLSIVKGFTEAHGGKVKLENINSGGAKFTITIPTETNYIKNLKNE